MMLLACMPIASLLLELVRLCFNRQLRICMHQADTTCASPPSDAMQHSLYPMSQRLFLFGALLFGGIAISNGPVLPIAWSRCSAATTQHFVCRMLHAAMAYRLLQPRSTRCDLVGCRPPSPRVSSIRLMPSDCRRSADVCLASRFALLPPRHSWHCHVSVEPVDALPLATTSQSSSTE